MPPHPTRPPPSSVSLLPPAGSQGWAWPEEGAELGSGTGWKSALLEARAVVLALCPAPSPPHPQLHHLRGTAAKAAADFQIPHQFLLVHQCQVQQSTSPSCFLHHPCQERHSGRHQLCWFPGKSGRASCVVLPVCWDVQERGCTRSRCGVCVDCTPSCPYEHCWDQTWRGCNPFRPIHHQAQASQTSWEQPQKSLFCIYRWISAAEKPPGPSANSHCSSHRSRHLPLCCGTSI